MVLSHKHDNCVRVCVENWNRDINIQERSTIKWTVIETVTRITELNKCGNQLRWLWKKVENAVFIHRFVPIHRTHTNGIQTQGKWIRTTHVNGNSERKRTAFCPQPNGMIPHDDDDCRWWWQSVCWNDTIFSIGNICKHYIAFRARFSIFSKFSIALVAALGQRMIHGRIFQWDGYWIFTGNGKRQCHAMHTYSSFTFHVSS